MNGTQESSSANKTTNSKMGISSLIMWCSAFGIVDILVVGANVVALLVFNSSRRLLKKRHNQFLIVLAISDIMVGLTVIPLYVYHLISWWLESRPLLGNALRDVFNAVDILSGFASIFTLAAIAADRVYAIVFPFYHKVPPRGVYPSMIASVWMLSGLLVVYYFLSRIDVLPIEAFIYLLLCSISFSLLVICVSYLLVWARVKCFKISHGLKGTPFRERRLAELLFLLTVIFICTWLPFHVVNFIFHFCKPSNCRPPPVSLVYFSKLLHYSNSFLNPIVYCYRNSEFRRCLKKLVRNLSSRSKPVISDKKEHYGMKERRLLLERQDAFRRILIKESRVWLIKITDGKNIA